MSFLAITLAPATALAWLSWRLLQQDRALESQRVRERLERSADLVVAALARRLGEAENQLAANPAAPAADPAGNALLVSFTSGGIEVRPGGRLLYYPVVAPSAPEPPAEVFQAGEAFEYRRQDSPSAIAAFRELSRSPDPLIRAGALLRLARNLRKNGQADEAFAVYGQLTRLGPLPVAGMPADLLARAARCARLQELGQMPELQREAAALSADLEHGRWPLDRAAYLLHTEAARRWASLPPDTTAGRRHSLALAEAVEWLWNQWQQLPRDQPDRRGRQSLWLPDGPVVVLWHANRDKLTALVAGPRHVESAWGAVWSEQRVALALSDPEGHPFLGRPVAAATQYAIRASADTRLPWTLRVSSALPGPEFAQLAGRRRLLFAGLAMMALLTLLGGYFTARATARELAVARLQSDFVSAVSHEFRTPLTSLRHLTELLARGTVAGEDRRRQYYAIMARETERLHRLVEGLLDFGRMAAGQREYSFEALDPVELVAGVVNDFRADLEPGGRPVELTTTGVAARDCSIRADPEALARAIRNLLDNAAKYSPAPAAIGVELARDGERVAIHVRDQGVGIAPAEQTRIFEKFVRGTAAQALHVKGTGIGLAMVQHIVQAHGGEIRLHSEPGRGSTFSLLLPAEPAAGPGTHG